MTDHGCVHLLDGTKVALTQQAYPDGDGNATWYEAAGRDAAGNVYRVRWSIVDAECDDEMDACDWANPYEVKLVEVAT